MISSKPKPMLKLVPALPSLLLILSALPASATVSRLNGECFERLITSSKIIRSLGKCTIYMGAYGYSRVLWGFETTHGKVNAYADLGMDPIVNGKPGYLYIPSKVSSPDRLKYGQYFCLGYRGKNLMTCGRLISYAKH